MDYLRTSYFGRCAYTLSGGKYFSYPEELPDYVVPKQYLENEVIIDWEENDPHNPKNWSMTRKLVVTGLQMVLNFGAYMGGAICTPATEIIMKEFNCSYVVSTLPLCMYIIGYGTSMTFLSPLSEQPSIGRNPTYIWPGLIFVLFQIPCALCKNIETLVVCRFISGLACSLPLSVGAATFADVSTPAYLPAFLVIWGCTSFCGPSMGPLIGIGLINHSGWRTIYWFLCGLVGGTTILLLFFSPETNASTLLLWRAQRLRKVTGNNGIIARSELEAESIVTVLYTVITRAFEIMFLEPIVLLINTFQAVCYGIVYMWFEAFPIAYKDLYRFSDVGVNAAYNTINVGVFFGSAIYLTIVYTKFSKRLVEGEPVGPELFLNTGCLGAVLVTISLFWFGWTVNKSIHWIVSLVGAAIFGAGSLMILQSNITYEGMIFPDYIASVFASNGMMRAYVAGTIPIYTKQMFEHLGTKNFPVGWGSSLLGFIFVVLTLIPLFFKKYGNALRRRSKYASNGM